MLLAPFLMASSISSSVVARPEYERQDATSCKEVSGKGDAGVSRTPSSVSMARSSCPASQWCWLRIPLGMMTWPLLDILVVCMESPFGKIIVRHLTKRSDIGQYVCTYC